VLKVGFLTIDAREYFKDYDTTPPYFGTAPQALLQGFAKVPNIEIHLVACVKQPVPHTPKLAENIFYHPLLVPGPWTRTLYAPCVKATRRKLQEIKPDIVHAQGTERDCALAGVYSGFPNIITIHGNMREVAKALRAPFLSFHTVQTILESWAIRRTIGVLCLTNYTREQVKDRTPRTWILPNAVNEVYFNLDRAAEPAREILCIANVDARKNQNFLIRALDPIAEANGMRLTFFGGAAAGNPYFDEFLALVKARPWCSFEGFKKGKELHDRLRLARFVILPSTEENCPMVVLEAMAIGVPVAAARSGGTPDLIDDGVNGLMFDPTDAEGLRRAVLKLWNDAPAANALAAAGKRRALERHHPKPIAEKHVEIYRDALSSVS
jgi:glycosyltransferase involved in cell wall biosynthesis